MPLVPGAASLLEEERHGFAREEAKLAFRALRVGGYAKMPPLMRVRCASATSEPT